MIHKEHLTEEIWQELKKRIEGIDLNLEVPPAVFRDMQGQIGKFDVSEHSLICHFPVLENQLNPYGNMQGGVISAAIDNTIGPLSMLVATPNVTRLMEVKYSKAVTPEMRMISVKAQFLKQEGRFLFFDAKVTNSEGAILASAKSKHFIL